MIFRATNRLHYMNPGIRVVQSLPAGADDWFLAGGAPMPVAVYNVREGGSLAGSYVNVVNPGTYNAAPGVAPTWSGVTGWGFNGTTQYLTTGIVPASGWAMLIRFSDYGGGTISNMEAAGYHKTGARFRLGASTDNILYASGDFALTPPVVASGVIAIAAQAGYRNGVAEAVIGGWTATADGDIYIGNANGLTRFWLGNIQYVAIWNTSTGHATWMPAVSDAVALL